MEKRRTAGGERKEIVAIGLLTDDDLARLGPQFSRAFPIDETPCFEELLRKIDEADRPAERMMLRP